MITSLVLLIFIVILIITWRYALVKGRPAPCGIGDMQICALVSGILAIIFFCIYSMSEGIMGIISLGCFFLSIILFLVTFAPEGFGFGG